MPGAKAKQVRKRLTAEDVLWLRKVGQRIKKYRDRIGKSQEALADATDIDRSYMSGIERGLRNVSVVKLRALARDLKVPISALLRD